MSYRPSVQHKLLLIKRKPTHNKSLQENNIASKLMSEFETLHPEGVNVYVRKLLQLYSDNQRYLSNMFIECSELLASVQDRRTLRLRLNIELEELKTESDGVIKKDDEMMRGDKLIPEEHIIVNRPNIIQEVKDAVSDPSAGGINERNLNKMELHIINTQHDFIGLNYWLRRVLLSIKDSVGNRRALLYEIKEMIYSLNFVLKKTDDNTNNTSVERDPKSVTRHSSQMKLIDIDSDSEPWELSTVEELLEVRPFENRGVKLAGDYFRSIGVFWLTRYSLIT